MTTVGYGDFGAYSEWEIIITIIWMAIGVGFYSIVVGTLTSIITDQMLHQETLQSKLKALETFSKENNLDETLSKNL